MCLLARSTCMLVLYSHTNLYSKNIIRLRYHFRVYITTRTQISSKPINGPIVIADKELNLVLTWNSALTNFTLVVIQNKCQWIALYKCVFQPFTRYISTLVFMQSNKCVMIFGIMYTLFSNKLTKWYGLQREHCNLDR